MNQQVPMKVDQFLKPNGSNDVNCQNYKLK